MQKTIVQLPEIKLVGIITRTNNRLEIDSHTARIGAIIQKFFSKNLSKEIKNKKNPGRIFAVYTNYESDFTGDYTYFIGEEVTSFDTTDTNFETITLPAMTYAKFTSEPGILAEVLIHLWEKVWQLKPADLGGQHAYVADFEVFSDKDFDKDDATADIYIGLENKH